MEFVAGLEVSFISLSDPAYTTMERTGAVVNYRTLGREVTFPQGGALAKWLERRNPDRETRVRSSAGSVCCFLEQETFTPQKYW